MVHKCTQIQQLIQQKMPNTNWTVQAANDGSDVVNVRGSSTFLESPAPNYSLQSEVQVGFCNKNQLKILQQNTKGIGNGSPHLALSQKIHWKYLLK